MKSNLQKEKQAKITRRAKRVRAKFFGTAKKPRLSVFKSSKHLYAQLIDDAGQKTLASVNNVKAKGKKEESGKEIGLALATAASKLGIKECVFDRGSYKYHGLIKNLAEGAREGGLKF